MELIRGQHNLRPHHHGCVATIGNFDGVHLGHQTILRQLAAQSRLLGLPTVVITFEPQPLEYFSACAPPRLMRLREKLLALADQGVDRTLCLIFDHRLAEMPAPLFIQDLLVAKLGVRYLVVGDDFRFGHKRAGDFAMLCDAGRQYGFQVTNTQSYILQGERVSSTRIRRALGHGELELAATLLGRSYSMCGRVAHGDKRGRTLGYPTANIHLHRRTTPLSGVYAVHFWGVSPQPLRGVANIGRRPTVLGTRDQLEVHLFDFQEDIYGCHVQVDFLHNLRPERRFDSLDALKRQIQCDSQQAKVYFAAQAQNIAVQ